MSPVTKGQNNGIKMGDNEISKTPTLTYLILFDSITLTAFGVVRSS